MKQYSPEYWQEKIGKISASSMSKLVTSAGKKSSSWKALCYKLAAEIERGMPEESFQSEAMKNGLEMEPEARGSFEFITGIKMQEVGLVYQNKSELYCCSPDGISLDRKTGLEIKCPSAGVHMQYLHENKLPTVYKGQVFSSLWICDELEQYAFYSYHPDMKPLLIFVDRENEEYKTYVEGLYKYLPEFINFIHDVSKAA